MNNVTRCFRCLLKIAFVVSLVGCASSTYHRDRDGGIWKITTRGNISSTYEKGEEKMSVDSKWEIFKGIFNLNKVGV